MMALVKGGSMVDKINATAGIEYTAIIPDIAYVKLKLLTIVFLAHIILLFFIARENANFFNISFQKTI